MDLFVYGTLTDPGRVDDVVDAYAYLGPAVLDGLHPVEGRYPTLAPGGRTGGRLLRVDDVSAVDRYEGVESGLYVRVSVPVHGGDEAAVYVGDPERLGADATWGGAGSFRERVGRYVADAGVVVRPSDAGR
ncbi:MAG: gamma-glutamylcyclotransferase [Haloferacaceae archaeon]